MDTSPPPKPRNTLLYVLVAVVGLLVLGGLGVVACIGAFTALGVTSAKRYELQSKLWEVPANVNAIRLAEQYAYEVRGAYVAVGSEAEAVARVGKLRQPWPREAGWDALEFDPGQPVYGAYWVEATGDGFVVHGVADLDGDGELARFRGTKDERAVQTTPDDVF